MKATNDHTVPQAYLRRFAAGRSGKGHFIIARSVEDPSVAFETNVRNMAAVKGFYWSANPDGTPAEHGMEVVLGRIESGAAAAFSAVLDDHDYALPGRWPLPQQLRERIAWWIAAQILRTTRQRDRLEHHLVNIPGLDIPKPIAKAASANAHIAFIAGQLARLATVVYDRPWGVGFSDACLVTSDVPVVLLHEHDSDDQVFAAAISDIVVPLDPHRFLYLPGLTALRDRRKRIDHRIKLDGGLGLFVSEILRDAADRFILHHPAHEPPWLERPLDIRPRLPRPWRGEDHSTPEYYVSYAVLSDDVTVERRWLSDHPPPAGAKTDLRSAG